MLHVGALLDRAPGRKYTAALRFAELSLRAPLPRPGTLASMRAALGEDFVFALRAPRSAVSSTRGALRSDPELDASVQWLNAAADALQARAVIIHTPSDLTPGARSRDLLREYFAQLPRVAGRHYVWSAQGAWEPEEAQAVCNDLGLCRAFDPLETKSTPGAVAYATLRALGHRAGFSYAALADALTRTLAHQPEEAFISVDAERGFDVARRLATLVTQARAEAAELGGDDELEDDDEDEDEADAEGDEDAPEDKEP
jgi:uncharacterized protein YecE (DUF72 family)